ncbi:MAG: CoA pyrophosphatase [Bacteroidia bacterium]|nr:CoA pyrophosphatase [Bacteroidia bacterium]
MEAFVQKLKDRIKQPLPGQEAQYLMAPLHRSRVEIETLKVNDYRPSAVMILFCEDEDGSIYIPLTERMSYNGAHSGQISLPGGKFDQSDKDLQETAIRECFEEIGISALDIIGKLTEMYIPVSRFLVHPYLAVCRERNPVMTIQEREVKSIVKLSIDTLLKTETIEKGRIEATHNMVVSAPWFNINGHKVWGATAMILSELKELIRTTS